MKVKIGWWKECLVSIVWVVLGIITGFALMTYVIRPLMDRLGW